MHSQKLTALLAGKKKKKKDYILETCLRTHFGGTSYILVPLRVQNSLNTILAESTL